MRKKKSGLSSAAKKMDLAKAMRSRLSDTLIPPPMPSAVPIASPSVMPSPVTSAIAAAVPGRASRYSPKTIAERVWGNLMASGAESDFEVKFTLADGREFSISGDKEGFASVRELEPFDVPGEEILEKYHGSVSKVELSSDEKNITFGAFADFVEWLELD